MIQSMTIRKDTKQASFNDKTGEVVAYSNLSGKVAVKFKAWKHNGVSYKGKYMIFNIIEIDHSGLLIILKVVEQIRFPLQKPEGGYPICF